MGITRTCLGVLFATSVSAFLAAPDLSGQTLTCSDSRLDLRVGDDLEERIEVDLTP